MRKTSFSLSSVVRTLLVSILYSSIAEVCAFDFPCCNWNNRVTMHRSTKHNFATNPIWGIKKYKSDKSSTLRMVEDDDSDYDSDGESYEGGDLDTPSIVLEDLSWRVDKLRLEEANKKRFLKSRPIFLPYEECRKWVAAWGRWSSEGEWNDWIDMGEKRNSYVPSCPDEYYGRRGEWISWAHFLGLEEEGQEFE